MNQATIEILASRVTPEGAAMLLMEQLKAGTEQPNVSEPKIERVPGWTDQMVEKCEQLQAENKLLLEAVKNPVQSKGWRYPKPGDKLRVVKVPTGSYDFVEVGAELEASAFCQTTFYDAEHQRSDYAVNCQSPSSVASEVQITVVLPLDCVEPI